MWYTYKYGYIAKFRDVAVNIFVALYNNITAKAVLRRPT